MSHVIYHLDILNKIDILCVCFYVYNIINKIQCNAIQYKTNRHNPRQGKTSSNHEVIEVLPTPPVVFLWRIQVFLDIYTANIKNRQSYRWQGMLQVYAGLEPYSPRFFVVLEGGNCLFSAFVSKEMFICCLVPVTQYNTVQYNTIQYNTIQYNTIQYNTIQYINVSLVPVIAIF